MALYNQSFTKDANLALKAAGLIDADADHTTVDLGGDGFFEGFVVIDVSAIEIASNDELYQIQVQLSSDNFVAENIVKMTLPLGATEVVEDSTGDSTTGRYVLPVNNEWLGVGYRYIRLHTEVSGTIATGINFSAFLAAR